MFADYLQNEYGTYLLRIESDGEDAHALYFNVYCTDERKEEWKHVKEREEYSVVYLVKKIGIL